MAARKEDLLCDFGGKRWNFLSHRPRTQSAFEVGDVVVVGAARSSSGSSFGPGIHTQRPLPGTGSAGLGLLFSINSKSAQVGLNFTKFCCPVPEKQNKNFSTKSWFFIYIL